MYNQYVPADRLQRSDQLVEEQIRNRLARQQFHQSYRETFSNSSTRTKVIIAANRLPVTLKRDPNTGDWTGTKSSGGLVTGLSAVRGFEMLWVGWPGAEIPEDEQPGVLQILKNYNCYPVWLSQELINLYYNGFANNVIWPLFHYVMPPLPVHGVIESTAEQWKGYQRANEMFTEAIIDVYDEDDCVWVQDYHLMLVPKMLRDRVRDAHIGWFLHTPFPASEYFRVLKMREELLTGLLSANLVAFHVYDYIRHFLSSVVQLTSLETAPAGVDATPIGGCFVRCATIPIGIAPQEFTTALKSDEVQNQISILKEQFGDRKVVLGVDRLDYMKGIPNKLRAFDQFLTRYPEWANQCVLVQVAVPSRQDVTEYQKLKKIVHEAVGDICGRHSTLVSGPPVIYLDQSVDHEQLTALYRVADVCLITSIRDGMNLVSYEFIACQEEKHGVLILSEFAGAAQSLGAGSIRVNPWNLNETAAAILKALTMEPEERAARHEYAWKTIHKYTAQKWAEIFIRTLREACVESAEMTARVPPVLPYEEMLEEFSTSKKRLLIFDLLDCLVPSKVKKNLPIKLYQSLLVVPSMVLQCIAALSRDPNTTVVIVTIHHRSILERLFGHLPIILAAENGCIYRGASTNEWRCAIPDEAMVGAEEWMSNVMDVFTYFKERTPGSYTERQDYAIHWYYDNTQSDFGNQQARELLIYLWAGPLVNSEAEVVLGTKSITVRPHGTGRASNLTSILQIECSDILDDLDFVACFAEVPFRDDTVFEAIEDLLTAQDSTSDVHRLKVVKEEEDEDHHWTDSLGTSQVIDLHADSANEGNPLSNPASNPAIGGGTMGSHFADTDRAMLNLWHDKHLPKIGSSGAISNMGAASNISVVGFEHPDQTPWNGTCNHEEVMSKTPNIMVMINNEMCLETENYLGDAKEDPPPPSYYQSLHNELAARSGARNAADGDDERKKDEQTRRNEDGAKVEGQSFLPQVRMTVAQGDQSSASFLPPPRDGGTAPRERILKGTARNLTGQIMGADTESVATEINISDANPLPANSEGVQVNHSSSISATHIGASSGNAIAGSRSSGQLAAMGKGTLHQSLSAFMLSSQQTEEGNYVACIVPPLYEEEIPDLRAVSPKSVMSDARIPGETISMDDVFPLGDEMANIEGTPTLQPLSSITRKTSFKGLATVVGNVRRVSEPRTPGSDRNSVASRLTPGFSPQHRASGSSPPNFYLPKRSSTRGGETNTSLDKQFDELSDDSMKTPPYSSDNPELWPRPDSFEPPPAYDDRAYQDSMENTKKKKRKSEKISLYEQGSADSRHEKSAIIPQNVPLYDNVQQGTSVLSRAITPPVMPTTSLPTTLVNRTSSALGPTGTEISPKPRRSLSTQPQDPATPVRLKNFTPSFGQGGNLASFTNLQSAHSATSSSTTGGGNNILSSSSGTNLNPGTNVTINIGNATLNTSNFVKSERGVLSHKNVYMVPVQTLAVHGTARSRDGSVQSMRNNKTKTPDAGPSPKAQSREAPPLPTDDPVFGSSPTREPRHMTDADRKAVSLSGDSHRSPIAPLASPDKEQLLSCPSTSHSPRGLSGTETHPDEGGIHDVGIPPEGRSSSRAEIHGHLSDDSTTAAFCDKISYFSVSLGRRMSRAKYSLPNPYHVQNLLRSMFGLLEVPQPEAEERSRAVLVGPAAENPASKTS